MLLQKLVDILSMNADTNLDRAYKILGAKPGPGLDLEIWPVEPVCGKWFASGCTKAGRAFISKFWADQPIRNNKSLGRLKREATEWGLKYKVTLKFEPIESEIKYD